MSGTKKLNIVVASELYRPSTGGTELTTENLARGLQQLGHNVLVIAPGGSLRTHLIEDDAGQRVLRVRSIPFPVVPGASMSVFPYRDIQRELDRFKPDVIHINNHYHLGQALIRYGRRRSIPVVAGIHFMPESYLFNIRRLSMPVFNTLRRLWWRRIAHFYNGASCVVAPSFTGLELITGGGCNVPGYVISNGIDTDMYQPARRSLASARRQLELPERPTAVYLGRLSPEKQLDVLVYALAKAAQQTDMQLVVVGDGWVLPDLQRTAERYDVADRIIFTGYVTNEQKITYIQAADLCVMPSTVELQSIVTLEEMAMGKPIAAVDEGALPELVRSGVNGWLFGVRDSDRLAEIYSYMSTKKQQLGRLGRQSRTIATDHDIKDMPAHYAMLYRELIAQRDRSEP